MFWQRWSIMPRKAREKSSTGIYHIMLRGANRQDIFYDDEDRVKYIQTLEGYKDASEYKIYGYCLMSNHIHLLIREGKEPISKAMKRIGVSYVYWYNMKYERCGHLFQDRYKSEVVENDKYLMVVLRYIHQNPLKAHMIDNCIEYKWSSYVEYISQETKLTDIDFVLDSLNSNRNKAVEIFEKFTNEKSNDKCLDYDDSKRKVMTDEEAKKLILKFTSLSNPQILLKMDKKDRDNIIRKLKDEDISIRQLSRITGLGRGVIDKVK